MKTKYLSKKITVDGQTFDSKGEYQRWLVLCDEERRCGITHLERQVVFPLYASVGCIEPDDRVGYKVDFLGSSQFIGDFTADFVYRKDGQLVVEDYKSPFTAKEKAFRRTKLLFEACYHLPLTITTNKGTVTEYSNIRGSRRPTQIKKKLFKGDNT